jgi:hypothetical protein
MMEKPKNTTSLAEKELDKAEEQFKKFDENVRSLTLDRMNTAPKKDVEPQTKISQSDLAKTKDIYLKPTRSYPCTAKFNENYRNEYNFAKEFVQFMAENKEIGGEDIEMWTKPFAGVPCELWKVPVNKPIWAPRYLAEQIKRCYYHRLRMDNTVIGTDGHGQYHGSMAVDSTVQRLDAIPVSGNRSIFMGAANF